MSVGNLHNNMQFSKGLDKYTTVGTRLGAYNTDGLLNLLMQLLHMLFYGHVHGTQPNHAHERHACHTQLIRNSQQLQPAIIQHPQAHARDPSTPSSCMQIRNPRWLMTGVKSCPYKSTAAPSPHWSELNNGILDTFRQGTMRLQVAMVRKAGHTAK